MISTGRIQRLRSILRITALETIVIDADDTLWYDARYFRKLADYFLTIAVRAGIPQQSASARLDEAINKKAPGEAGYVAAIESAAERLQVDEDAVYLLKMAMNTFRSHDLDLLPGVMEGMKALKRFRITMLTKGIPHEQLSKLNKSRLEEYFDKVIVSDRKNADTSADAFEALDARPGRAVVIGNSIKHDVLPARSYGLYAIWFNHSENFYGTNASLPPEVPIASEWAEIQAAVDSLYSRSRLQISCNVVQDYRSL